MGVIVLDTSVLVYAVGADHPLRGPCRRLVDRITEGKIEASTTPEVIEEFVHVRSHRRSRREAVALGRDYVALLTPLLVVEHRDLDRGLRLFERHPPIGCFDAVLAAAALSRGADALVSADRAFALVRGLTYIDPATPAIERLLS